MKKKGVVEPKNRVGTDFILHLWNEEKKRFVGLCSLHVSQAQTVTCHEWFMIIR